MLLVIPLISWMLTVASASYSGCLDKQCLSESPPEATRPLDCLGTIVHRDREGHHIWLGTETRVKEMWSRFSTKSPSSTADGGSTADDSIMDVEGMQEVQIGFFVAGNMEPPLPDSQDRCFHKQAYASFQPPGKQGQWGEQSLPRAFQTGIVSLFSHGVPGDGYCGWYALLEWLWDIKNTPDLYEAFMRTKCGDKAAIDFLHGTTDPSNITQLSRVQNLKHASGKFLLQTTLENPEAITWDPQHTSPEVAAKATHSAASAGIPFTPSTDPKIKAHQIHALVLMTCQSDWYMEIDDLFVFQLATGVKTYVIVESSDGNGGSYDPSKSRYHLWNMDGHQCGAPFNLEAFLLHTARYDNPGKNHWNLVSVQHGGQGADENRPRLLCTRDTCWPTHDQNPPPTSSPGSRSTPKAPSESRSPAAGAAPYHDPGPCREQGICCVCSQFPI